MPIEIRELVIRATVDPGAAAASGCGSSPSRTGGTSAADGQAGSDGSVVQSCVREVLRILDDKRER
jgi:hypothetical protein